VPRLPLYALTVVRPTSQYARLIAMTTPGDSSERPPEDQPPPGQEPTPFDQAETQFAPIPPPEYEPPAYAHPPPPPESGTPPSGYPPPSYPPPSYTPPQGGYPPPPQSYQPPPGGYPPQPPYQSGPQPPYQSGPQPPYQSGYPSAPYQSGYPSAPYQSGYPSAPYAGGYGASQPRTNGMAIGSLVASIVGVPLTFLCYTGALGAIVGIVLGFIAINQIKQSGEEGRGFAIAGIIIGAVTLLLTVVLIIIGVGYYAMNR
jgi:hypothetical protein